ncbi:hypothetical protein ACHAWF_001751 [Thalassiosira exigua]
MEATMETNPSVASDLVSDRINAGTTGPPSACRSNSLPDVSSDDGDFCAASRRQTLADFRALSVSESTRRVLSMMDEDQMNNAREALKEVKETRRRSALMVNRSSVKDRAEPEQTMRRLTVEDRPQAEGRIGSRIGLRVAEGRKFSQSMGPLGELGGEAAYDESDEDEDQAAGGTPEPQNAGNSSEIREKHDATFDGEGELKVMSRSLEQLDELAEKASNGTQLDEDAMPQTSIFSKPARRARREGIAPRDRRKGTMSTIVSATSVGGEVRSAWKPLSSDRHDPEEKEECISKAAKGGSDNGAAATGLRGIGGLWNKLTSSFVAEGAPEKHEESLSPTSEPSIKKEVDGSTYFRRGKRKANKCQFLQAVALYNVRTHENSCYLSILFRVELQRLMQSIITLQFQLALVRQREELGENHIDCGTTLNEIGVCWMMLGERYPALSAFEEALYIRQRELGDGAREVAETTNNIWMILHEEREEMMEEVGSEDEN